MSTELYFSQPLGVSIERDVVSAPLLGLGVEGVDVVSAVYILQGSERSHGTVLCLFTHLCDGTARAGGYRRLYDSSPLLIR